ncbi:MAG: efflux RND transporter periplasmic adaptor subunit [Phycisphaerae bacterium]|nr:efflux RND transporter periplasmic adaptor subunit [Phycisphaerae bacterium]
MNASPRVRLSALLRTPRKWALPFVAAVIGLAVGLLLRPASLSRYDMATTAPAGEHDHGRQVTIWTCSMHPEVRLPAPGRCPKCGMTLIPVETEGPEMAGVPRLEVSPEARALMGVETAPVERKFVTAEIHMVGKVDFDETRQATITAWVPGRLDRLYVDYTGLPVRKGDHMVLLYSPELLSAQTELLQALVAVKDLSASTVEIVRTMAEATVAAAREKLRLLGLTPEQIAELERTGQASDHVTIYAPVGGIVTRKDALEGMYVSTGTPIYTIADLSAVWVKLDAYESDLIWLRYGQTVEFTAVSYPGEVFHGRVAFIDPVLDARTRTAKVRLDVPNADGRLKPEMFVKAVVRAGVAAGGKVMDPDLAGKWICPMHPSVIKSAAGNCDICGMPLATTESLGYVSADAAAAQAPLVIPASAALTTGKRAIVYVELEGTDQPTFEGRQVLLGPRAGDYYLVYSGLDEGQRVVTRGNFKIDSALQIQARPSMMLPQTHPAATTRPASAPTTTSAPLRPTNPAFTARLSVVFDAYLAASQALARDDVAGAVAAAGLARQTLSAVDMTLLSAEEHQAWMASAEGLDKALAELAGAADLQAARKAFAGLSESMISLARRYGPGGGALVRLHCPMAFDRRGADWLQRDRQVRNPYFGSAMPECGEVVETIPATAGQGARP